MAVVPVLPAVTPGVWTSSQQSQVQSVVAFLLAKPVAELRQATTQSIPNATWTPITFDAEDYDSAGGHDNATNNSRYVAQYAGVYMLAGGYAPSANTTGGRGIRWHVNGSIVNASDAFYPASGASGGLSFPARVKRVFLNVGDYVELAVWQNSGAGLSSSVSAEDASSMSIAWERNA